MLNNMIQRLAQISTQTPKASVVPSAASLNMECAVLTHSYGPEHTVGNVLVRDITAVDANFLKHACLMADDMPLTIEDIVFFDTETTGLGYGSGVVAFLIGVAYVQDGQLHCEQYLMQDYPQELSVLHHLHDVLNSRKAVASFNGRSFDGPLIQSRAILNRLNDPLEGKIHLDLLHASRRLFRRRLQRCSLSQLEERILDIVREDDIPSGDIPEIFFQYLKSGETAMLDKVIEHNLQDIVSLAGLAYILCDAFTDPAALIYPDDILSQGIIFERLGCMDSAKMCYNILGQHQEAITRLAFLNKREQHHEAAYRLFDQAAKLHLFDVTADIEAAKLCEHKLHNIQQAITHTRAAMNKVHSSLNSADPVLIHELNHRLERLNRKLNKE